MTLEIMIFQEFLPQTLWSLQPAKNQSKHRQFVLYVSQSLNVIKMEVLETVEVIAKPEVDSFDEKPDLAHFLSEAKLIDPDLLCATIGPLIYPHISIWDVLIQKTKLLQEEEMVLSPAELIQILLNEVEQLINEVKALSTSCCEIVRNDVETKVEQIIPLSRNMTKALSLASHDCLSPKDYQEIPQYYLDLLFPHISTKIEPPDEYDTNVTYSPSSHAIDGDHDVDVKDEEIVVPKRKYTKKKVTSSAENANKLKRRRPQMKNTPPELKLTAEENDNVYESQRRQRCDICTKGFQNKKKMEEHKTNGDCPGKPNPKWHYFNSKVKKLFCIQ